MAKLEDAFWTQGPNDFKDYACVATEWLGETNPPDTILTAVCAVDDPSLVLSNQLVSTNAVVIYASGGVVGRIYTIEVHITTAAAIPRRVTGSCRIWVKDPP